MLKKLVISAIATGAIAFSSVFATTDASAATQASNYSTTKYVKSYDGTLNVRTAASATAKKVATVKNNAKVKTTSKKVVSGVTWVKGTVSGKTGWMNAKYLSNNKVKKASSSNSSLIAYGAKFQGTPYVWGGTTPRGFDCSGFTSYVYKNATGKTLPRTSRAQYASSQKVSRSNLQAGDLVFFAVGSSSITHVALYAGNGQLLHAAGSSVHYQSLAGYWDRYVVGYGRY
ncbi:MAG: C40 family peptidase [Kurthia sp.]|nr:C40 family peptidase [Candidatus Kurthia equi]